MCRRVHLHSRDAENEPPRARTILDEASAFALRDAAHARVKQKLSDGTQRKLIKCAEHTRAGAKSRESSLKEMQRHRQQRHRSCLTRKHIRDASAPRAPRRMRHVHRAHVRHPQRQQIAGIERQTARPSQAQALPLPSAPCRQRRRPCCCCC